MTRFSSTLSSNGRPHVTSYEAMPRARFSLPLFVAYPHPSLICMLEETGSYQPKKIRYTETILKIYDSSGMCTVFLAKSCKAQLEIGQRKRPGRYYSWVIVRPAGGGSQI